MLLNGQLAELLLPLTMILQKEDIGRQILNGYLKLNRHLKEEDRYYCHLFRK